MDERGNLPVKDENGKYIATKTAGIKGTQSDVIRAAQGQNLFMIHVVDAIEIINHSHNPDGKAIRIPEGYVWSSLDCVALDLHCARYCFKTVHMIDGMRLKEENGWPTEFVHHVPVARAEGPNIVTEEGLAAGFSLGPPGQTGQRAIYRIDDEDDVLQPWMSSLGFAGDNPKLCRGP